VGETQHGGNAAVMNSDGRETGWARSLRRQQMWLSLT